MANSADTDQLASSEANWSGSTLFAKAGYTRVQQDKEVVSRWSKGNNEAVCSHELNSASSGIRTQNLMILSWDHLATWMLLKC